MTDKFKLEFPCEYFIKVMGKKSEEFEAAILPIIHKHVPDLGEASISMRESKEGKYISFTIHINATSKDQLDAIYMELSDCKLVLMAL